MMTKYRIYEILATDGVGYSVNAYNIYDAYKKAGEVLERSKLLFVMPQDTILTPRYMTFGFCSLKFAGYRKNKSSIMTYNRYLKRLENR